jgi:hypothetical protein
MYEPQFRCKFYRFASCNGVFVAVVAVATMLCQLITRRESNADGRGCIRRGASGNLTRGAAEFIVASSIAPVVGSRVSSVLTKLVALSGSRA